MLASSPCGKLRDSIFCSLRYELSTFAFGASDILRTWCEKCISLRSLI